MVVGVTVVVLVVEHRLGLGKLRNFPYGPIEIPNHKYCWRPGDYSPE